MSERPVPPTLPELEANLTRLWSDAQPRPAFVAELERELRAPQPTAVSTWPARLSVALGTLALTVVVALALAVIGRWRMPLPNAVSTATAQAAATTPAPASPAAASTPMGGALTLQEDPDCGVRFLRPQGWVLATSSQDCSSRLYAAPGSSGKADRLVLQAINYYTLAEQAPGGPGGTAQYLAFQQDNTLDGWTRLVEKIWAGISVTATLENYAPDARVYALHPPGGNEIELVGLKVDQGQPLGLVISANGAYANLDRLRAEHVFDEFLAMVNSLAASSPTAQSGMPTPTAQTDLFLPACFNGATAVSLSPLPDAWTHAGWKHYALSLYPLGIDVPPDWHLAVGRNYLCLIPQAAPHVALTIGFRGPIEAVNIVRSGVAAGDIITRGTVSIQGQTITRNVLVYQGKDKAVLYNSGVEIGMPQIALTASLDDFGPDYDAAVLPPAVQATADQIVATLEGPPPAPNWPTYASPAFQVRVQYPPSWQPDNTGLTLFNGPDGFFSITAVASLAPNAQAACQLLAENNQTHAGVEPEFGHHPTTQTVQVDHQPACLIWPSIDQAASQRGEALLLVDYPDAISPHKILQFWADKSHIEGLGARLTFIRTP